MTLSVNSDNGFRLENLLEQVCDNMNLKNHYGILSMVAQGAVSLAKNKESGVEVGDMTFSVQPCRGGIQMEIQADEPLFQKYGKECEVQEEISDESRTYYFLLRHLADNITIHDNEKKLTITFFIAGIESIYELERQTRLGSYFQRKTVPQTL